MYVPKWLTFLPVAVLAALAWQEYPALIRYFKIARM